MPEEQIAFHVSFASVDSLDGADPSAASEQLLRAQRVLAGSRGFDGDEAVFLIPVTEDQAVVALDDEGRLRFDLTATALQELFASEGMTLHLGLPDDALEDVDMELDEEFGAAFEQIDDPAASSEDLAGFGMPEFEDADDDDFAVEPVRVSEFSHRGPWGARFTAQLAGVAVDYSESETWSLYRYATDQPHMAVSGGRAEHPIIEVNEPQHGETWVEVTVGSQTAMIWPNVERLTRPVLDIDAIGVSESAEVYRRLLLEADGTREELSGLGLGEALDLEAAARACAPELLGGEVGEHARLRTLLLAFGVPEQLISQAFGADALVSDAAHADGMHSQASGRRFTARGWPRTIVDLLVGGVGETTPLTRRDRPLARAARFLRDRPALEAATSVGELAAGMVATRTRSPFVRGLGVLLIVDAVVDLAIWVRRMLTR